VAPEGAHPTQVRGFDALDLSSALRKTLRNAGYEVPTPIQREAIPHLLKGRDVLGCAQTGTGKTAAFALPILDQLLRGSRERGRREIQALVLAPTRELAAQIHESFEGYAAGSGLRATVVYGGVSKRPQAQTLRRGVDVLVATPGRLLDLLNDGVLDLGAVRFFVLDEADRMLDMGFVHDVRRIARAVPERRQTMLFSATMPREIESLANRLLHEPVRLAVDPVSSTVEPIEQSVYFVGSRQKTDLLKGLLAGGEVDRALVFTRTKHGANRLAQKLGRARIETAAIHGNKSQSARQSALRRFKEGRTRVVVATDVAARGIDVKGLSHVINFDLPNEPEAYVHRIGRTGRAGESGVAISLCSPEERGHLAAIERLTRRRLDRIETPEGLASESAREERGANRARSGGQAHPRHKGGRDRSGGAGRNGRGARPKGAARASSTSGSDDPRPRNGRPSRRRPTRRR
jgi:ATP-dependent RNA helicase RhlE